jgi:hypothetical protein
VRALVRAAVAGGAFLLLVAPPGHAQSREQRRAPATVEGERAARPAEQAARIVERFGTRAAEALGLEPERARRLQEVLRLSLAERADLARRRRDARRELAGLVRRGSPDSGRVDALLDELLRLRVEEAEVDRTEQRRLSAFLTPLERARFYHLKLRLARRAAQRAGGADPPR